MIVNNIKNFNLPQLKPLNKVAFGAQFNKLERQRDVFERQYAENNEILKKQNYLRKLKIYDSLAYEIAFSPKRIYEKTIHLISKGFDAQTAFDFASQDENTYAKILILIKKGASADCVLNLLDRSDKENETFFKLMKQGAQENLALKFSSNNYPHLDKILELVKQGVSFYEANEFITCGNKDIFNRIKNLGFSTPSAIQTTNTQYCRYLNDEQLRHFANVVQIIKKNSSKSDTLSWDIMGAFQHFKINPSENIEDLDKYLSEFDFKKLKKEAPATKKYSSHQMSILCLEHFLKHNKDLSKNSLKFKDDLTQYLSENLIDAPELNTILIAYPLTPREVGDVPSDWLSENQDKKEIRDKICNTIKKFQHNKNPNELSKELEKILNKKVLVEEIGNGTYADVYKICVENGTNICLKIFDNKQDTFTNRFHGRNIEPQIGLFLNNHSNNYVKMYFGLVGDETQKDIFLTTQFIDENTIPERNPNINCTDFGIDYYDDHNGNSIEGTIIDYGGVCVYRCN